MIAQNHEILFLACSVFMVVRIVFVNESSFKKRVLFTAQVIYIREKARLRHWQRLRECSGKKHEPYKAV